MTDLRAKAELLIGLAAYKSMVEGEYKRLHAELQGDYESLGIRGQDIEMADGTRMGGISLNKGTWTATVADEEALLDWVSHERPTEIETIQVHRVRPAFLKKLLDQAVKEGVGIDTETGEVLEFIRVSQSNPRMVVTSTREAKVRMKELIERGALPFELES